MRRATDRGVDFARLEAAGLARRNDRGRAYDFFRGRLMIPITDDRGRIVGFGARLLDDSADPRAPKYMNTPETRVFHKGRLVYALDRARQAARKARRVALVEGYTDVMAAHQAGLEWVCAVLGTSTTEDHAALLRRTGARRIDLVFDGDAAGRKAAWRALAGLLPLGVELAVATLPEGTDPCDMLTRDERSGPAPDSPKSTGASGPGAAATAFEEFLDAAPAWFDWVLAGLVGLDPAALAAAVDDALGLLEILPKPVEREARLAELARHLNIPLESLREQRRDHPAARARARRESSAGPPSRRAPASPSSQPQPQPQPQPPAQGQTSNPAPGQTSDALPARALPRISPRVLRAYDDLIGAVLADPGLVPLFRTYAPFCREPRLARIATAILAVADRDEDPTLAAVLSELADDPVRERAAVLCVRAQDAESPRLLFDGGVEALRELAEASALSKLQAELRDLERLLTRDEEQTRRLRELELEILERARARSHRRSDGLRVG